MRTKNYLLELWVCFSIVLIADVILSEGDVCLEKIFI